MRIYNKNFTIFIMFFVLISSVNGAIFYESHLFLSSEDLNNDFVEVDLNKISRVTIDDDYLITFSATNKALMADVVYKNSFQKYKLPHDSDNVFSYVTNDNVSIKFVLKNSLSLIEDESSNLEKVNLDDIASLVENDYIENGKVGVIVKFSEHLENNVNGPQIVTTTLGTQTVVVNTDKYSKDDIFSLNKQNFIADLEKFSSSFDINNIDSTFSILGTSSSSVSSDSNWVNKDLKLFNGISSKLTLEEINYLKNSRYVERISLDGRAKILLDDTAQVISADKLYNKIDSNGRDLTGKGVVVAVIDTGVDYTHEDFNSCSNVDYSLDNCERFVKGYDFVNDDDEPMDDEGHGTHVAGIIGANGVVQGLAPGSKIMPIKVLDYSGRGYYSDIILGMEYALDPNGDGDFSDKVDIVSMSLGGSGNPDDDLSLTADFLVENGVVVVIAAGNSGPYESTIGSPGTSRNAITVGASCKPSQIGYQGYCADEIARFSSRGPTSIGSIKPEIVAPGVEICSSRLEGAYSNELCIDSKHAAISGTSMATPVVSGSIALLLQANPDLTPPEIKSALMQSADDLGHDIYSQGSGQINVSSAYDIDFYTNPSIINLGKITSGDYVSTTFDIVNLNSAGKLYFVNVTDFEDELGNTYSIGSVSNSFFNVSGESSATVTLYVNLTGVEGVLSGRVLVGDGSNFIYVPVSLTKHSSLNVKLVDDLYGTTPDPLAIYVYNGNDTISELSRISEDTYTVNIISGNYTVYAFGEDELNNYYYYLMDEAEVELSSSSSKTMYFSNSREFNVDAKSFGGEDLTLYRFEMAFFAYRNDSRHMNNDYLSSSFSTYGFGDQKIRISKKPNNIDNVDFIVKSEGVLIE